MTSSVIRGGGIIQNGTVAIGQPSVVPGVRSDVAGFNVPFDRDKFTQMLKGSHGYEVTWEKAQYCPFLRGPSPKAHDINCKLCHSGFLYFDLQPTQMLVQALGVSQQYFAYGRFDSGKAQITAYPEFKISFWDRITLTQARARQSELVVRQRHGADRFKFNPVCIERITWAIGEQSFEIATDDDVAIDLTTGEVSWLTSHRPGADTYYSVVYFYRPVYIVMDVPHHVRDQKIPTLEGEDVSYEFPVQVIAQLDAFVRNEGLDLPNEGDAKNPFPVSR